jgi:hypothetical protein
MSSSQDLYEVPRKDRRGVNLISDVLPFGRLWYCEPNAVSNAVEYAKFYSRSHDSVIQRCCSIISGTPVRDIWSSAARLNASGAVPGRPGD